MTKAHVHTVVRVLILESRLHVNAQQDGTGTHVSSVSYIHNICYPNDLILNDELSLNAAHSRGCFRNRFKLLRS